MPINIVRTTQDPVEYTRPEPGGGKEIVRTHPAFVTISASRVSGKANLFNSAINHSGFVSITIKQAEEHETPHHSHIFGNKTLLELELSESQWASFVCNMNHGDTPGTLKYLIGNDNDGHIPNLPKPIDPVDKIHLEAQAMHEATRQKARESLEKALKEIDGMAIAQKHKDTLKSSLLHVGYALGANEEFAKKVVAERTEQRVNHAKIEIEAFANAAVRQLGLKSLGQLAEKHLELEQ